MDTTNRLSTEQETIPMGVQILIGIINEGQKVPLEEIRPKDWWLIFTCFMNSCGPRLKYAPMFGLIEGKFGVLRFTNRYEWRDYPQDQWSSNENNLFWGAGSLHNVISNNRLRVIQVTHFYQDEEKKVSFRIMLTDQAKLIALRCEDGGRLVRDSEFIDEARFLSIAKDYPQIGPDITRALTTLFAVWKREMEGRFMGVKSVLEFLDASVRRMDPVGNNRLPFGF